MKQILKYMLFAGVAMMAASCEREPLMREGGEGAVNFSIDYSAATRAAVNESDFTPDPIKVRIYRPEGSADSALIRRYTALDEIPDPLYLVSGDYSIKVEAGDKNNTAFIEDDADARKLKLCYEGWKSFTVSAHETTDIAVSCPTINVRANLLFDTSDSQLDATGRRIHENRLISDVKITMAALTTDATNVPDYKTALTAAEAPNLVFNQFETMADASGVATASGYFLLPEGVTTLVWAFEGQHETDGQIARIGTIRDVEPAHAYKVSFYYTRTPDGYAKVEVEIDDEVEIMEDDWYFKPQPEITGAGINAAAVNNYTEGNDVVLVCESINDLVTISLGGVAFFKDGAVVADAITGVSCVKNEATKVTITLSEVYFDTLNGGVQALSFGMKDAGSDEVYGQQIEFRKQGLVADETTSDLWANTASFKALVSDNVSTVKIQYREVGAGSWQTVTATHTATENGFKVFTATTVAGWNESTNVNGHQVFMPKYEQNIYANRRYEYQLVVDDMAEGPIAAHNPTAVQTIPDGNMESSSLPCWTEDASSSSFWGSGNNSLSATLCEQTTYTGSINKCAHLIARDPMSLLASGNLFTGTFTFGDPSFGLGTVRFGVPYQWKARPRALKLKYWAKIGNVNTAKHKTILSEGDPDQGAIYVCIIDWTKQHGVVSGTSKCSGVWSPEDGMNPNDAEGNSVGKIIGYAVFYPMGTTAGSSMIDKELEFVYYDKTAKPAAGNYSLIIACATSRYGDYMNGCNTNELYVDEFEWVY